MSTLERLFAREAIATEITAGRIRAVVLVLVELRIVLFLGHEMLAGELKHWLTTAVIACGLLASGALMRQQRIEALLLLSVVLDAALAFLIVLPSIVWPRPEFRGVLSVPDFAVWPIIATGAGLRLSRRAARLGPLAAMGGVGLLIAVDLTLHASAVGYGAAEIVLAAVMMVCGLLLAQGIEGRIRRLVQDGAEQAVHAERTRQRFGAYVSEELADALLDSEHAGTGSAELQQVAILFSDLRGFTRYSEQVGPEALIQELNAYLEEMVAVLREEGGVVDKYMGDGVLVVFGIPRRTGDEATRAVRAAVRMGEALQRHNEHRRGRGLEELSHGVAVHWGQVVAGNVGTPERLQYTVLGDAVNVASRLQGATRDLGVEVLLSEALVERARTEGAALPELRSLESLELRGRVAPIGVFTPLAGGQAAVLGAQSVR